MSKYKRGDKFIIEIADTYQADHAYINDVETLYSIKGVPGIILNNRQIDQLENIIEPDEEVTEIRKLDQGDNFLCVDKRFILTNTREEGLYLAVAIDCGTIYYFPPSKIVTPIKE